MAKWQGLIGFEVLEETSPGVWTPTSVEKEYRGEVIKDRQAYQNGTSINDDVSISVRISILSNPFVRNHLSDMRYIEYHGVHWKITSIDDICYPRITITIGGVYNGKQTSGDGSEIEGDFGY